MSILSGIRASNSEIVPNLQDPRFWSDWGMSAHTQAGIDVSPARALGLSTYYCCITGIAGDIAKLPIEIKTFNPDGTKKIAIDNPNRRTFIIQPNKSMTGQTFWECIIMHALSWGNGYAQIRKNINNVIVDFNLLHPSYLQKIEQFDTGDVEYTFRDKFGKQHILDYMEVFHLKGPSDDGLKGLSVCQLAAQAIGLGIAAEQFGASLFGNGQMPRIAITMPSRFKTEEDMIEFRRKWMERHGNNENWLSPAILQEGMDIKTLSIPPEDAQFLQTRLFQVGDICRWFHYPRSKAGDRSEATYASTEQDNKIYVDDALTPWMGRIRAESQAKVFDDFTIPEWDWSELIRGDSVARADYYSKIAGPMGLRANEIRDREGYPRIGSEGDFSYINGNMALVTPDGPRYPQKSIDNRSGADAKNQDSQHGNTDKATIAAAFSPMIAESAGKVWVCIKKAMLSGEHEDDVRTAQRDRLAKALMPQLSAIATLTKSEPLDCTMIASKIMEATRFPKELTENAYGSSRESFVLTATQITMKESLHE